MRRPARLSLLSCCGLLGPLPAWGVPPAQVHAGDDLAHPVRAAGWVETRLYIGLGAADVRDCAQRDAIWRVFLDHEVTPRFPAGFSVEDAYGQWQSVGERVPERLRSKVLIIDHPDLPADQAKIEAIRRAWKAKRGDRSVLEVTVPVRVSF